MGRPGKGRAKGGKEERKGGECKVKWMNRAMRKMRSGGESLLAIVMSSLVELQYAPVFNRNITIMKSHKFSYLRVISNC